MHDLVNLLLSNCIAKITGILVSGNISEKYLRRISTVEILFSIIHDFEFALELNLLAVPELGKKKVSSVRYLCYSFKVLLQALIFIFSMLSNCDFLQQ